MIFNYLSLNMVVSSFPDFRLPSNQWYHPQPNPLHPSIELNMIYNPQLILNNYIYINMIHIYVYIYIYISGFWFQQKKPDLTTTQPPTLQPSIETAVRTSRSTTPWPRKFYAPPSSRTCCPSSVPCVTWKRDWLDRTDRRIHVRGEVVVSPQNWTEVLLGWK